MKRLGLLERGQVLALQVLDQRQLHHLGIVALADDDRHFANSDLDGGMIPALAGDDLEPSATLPNDERLDDSFFGHRSHKL
jgi:hypothetical protein